MADKNSTMLPFSYGLYVLAINGERILQKLPKDANNRRCKTKKIKKL